MGKEDTLTNIAKVFTKLVPFTRKQELLARFLWDRWRKRKENLFGDKPLTNRGDRLNPDSTWNHSPVAYVWWHIGRFVWSLVPEDIFWGCHYRIMITGWLKPALWSCVCFTFMILYWLKTNGFSNKSCSITSIVLIEIRLVSEGMKEIADVSFTSASPEQLSP